MATKEQQATFLALHARVAAGLPAAACESPTPSEGPGTEMKKLLESLGLKGKVGCGCAPLADAMNRWGVEGCREHREAILAQLRKAQAKLGWLDKIKAAALAVKEGIAFKLDPADPAEGLLAEAVRRAAAKKGEVLVETETELKTLAVTVTDRAGRAWPGVLALDAETGMYRGNVPVDGHGVDLDLTCSDVPSVKAHGDGSPDRTWEEYAEPEPGPSLTFRLRMAGLTVAVDAG